MLNSVEIRKRGLKESITSAALLYGGKDLIGTSDEKAKYNDLIKLSNEIKKLIGHMQVENYYSNLIGIQFIVCNTGTQYDEDIFEIHACKHFIDYTSTSKEIHSDIPANNPLPLFASINYVEEYRETLDEIFDYIIYEDGDNVIIKIHMDYLKQHNCAAFPTWIF